MTFKEFILTTAKITLTSTGDFVLEARRDAGLPETAIDILDKYKSISRKMQTASKNCYANYRYHCRVNGMAPEFIGTRHLSMDKYKNQ